MSSTDTSKITDAANKLSSGLGKGGTAAKALGQEIANAFAALDARVTALESAEPPVQPPDDTVGLITGFNGANGARFSVDGIDVHAQNANQAWCVTNPDSHTLRFEVRPGDHWTSGSYSETAERSEIQFSQSHPAGGQINVSYRLTIEPGPVNTAPFVDLGQLHSDGSQNPPSPVMIGLDRSDHLEVVLQSPSALPNNMYVYKTPQPVVRGQAMELRLQMTMAPNGNGAVDVWLDGAQIVNYRGDVGTVGSNYYWKVGVYRGEAPETLSATFKNIHLTTG
jgi:hypothetical protein